MDSPIGLLLDKLAADQIFDDIDALPESYISIKAILRAAHIGDDRTVQPLYTKICQCSDPEISGLALHPHILLNTLLAVAISNGQLPIIRQVLELSPSPRPDLKRFLCRHGTAFSRKLTSIPNPEIRALMVRHGYHKQVYPQPIFDANIPQVIFGGKEDLESGVHCVPEPLIPSKMAQLRAAMKSNNLSEFESLLRSYPAEELKDCRLLHDATEDGKGGKVRYLIDVVKIDINMFPTERPEQETEFPHSYGSRTSGPNGTPLHEAVTHNRKVIVEMLLEKGARTDIKDEDGQTPYEAAKKRKLRSIMACFPEHTRRSGVIGSLRHIMRHR